MSDNIKADFQYELQAELTYSFEGAQPQASFILLKAPTSKNIAMIADLRQAFFQAIPKDGGGDEKDDVDATAIEDLDGDAIMNMIFMSKDVDAKNVVLSAVELFSSGVAVVDGSVKLTKPLINSMDDDDFINMIGEYYRNFILASWLKKLKKKLSES